MPDNEAKTVATAAKGGRVSFASLARIAFVVTAKVHKLRDLAIYIMLLYFRIQSILATSAFFDSEN